MDTWFALTIRISPFRKSFIKDSEKTLYFIKQTNNNSNKITINTNLNLNVTERINPFTKSSKFNCEEKKMKIQNERRSHKIRHISEHF